MNKLKLFLIVYFCLYVGINNRIINTQYSLNHEYCIKSEDPSLFESLDNAIDSLTNLAFSVDNILGNFNGDYQYMSFSDRIKAQREKEDEYNQIFPRAKLKRIAEQLNVNCILFDKRIDIIDDGTIKETPYNFRPLK